jgi:predicted DNA-binding transcriptional regulator AlpA
VLKTKAGNIVGNLPEEDRLLRLKEVKVVGLSTATIHRLIKQRRFPAPLHPLGNIIIAWPASVIQQWVADRKSGKAA